LWLTNNRQTALCTKTSDQRRDPKVITPRNTHVKGGEIMVMVAPMSHPSNQERMRDAVYTSLDQAKVAVDHAFNQVKEAADGGQGNKAHSA
jgi:hypothetical protein